MLSLFYTRKQLATRLAILYSGNIIATSVSGLIAVATFNTLSDVHGLSDWRWLSIIGKFIFTNLQTAKTLICLNQQRAL